MILVPMVMVRHSQRHQSIHGDITHHERRWAGAADLSEAHKSPNPDKLGRRMQNASRASILVVLLTPHRLAFA